MKSPIKFIITLTALLVSQIAIANELPNPQSGCDGLSWDSFDSPINVHAKGGEFIESVPAGAHPKIRLEPGEYYLVVADSSDWRDWRRTELVSYERPEQSLGGCIDPNLLTDNLNLNILSENEIEITWDQDSRFGYRFSHYKIIFSNDTTLESETFIAPGTSYYTDKLLPDNVYTFALVPVDIYDWEGDSVTIFDEISTAGFNPIEFEINEQTISFGFQDWYQVQDASTYATLCEGFNDCTVPSGEYIIINHTTGDRFYDIRVGDSTQPVENGVITFPGDGWYQVQEAYTFQSICEGGTSCIVPPGTWLVINHTTGERTIQVVTGIGGGNGGSGDIVVDGQTISWPSDGWYQVLNANTFAAVCEGGSSCSVADNGTYIVINLTTGQRWENIRVQ